MYLEKLPAKKNEVDAEVKMILWFRKMDLQSKSHSVATIETKLSNFKNIIEEYRKINQDFLLEDSEGEIVTHFDKMIEKCGENKLFERNKMIVTDVNKLEIKIKKHFKDIK